MSSSQRSNPLRLLLLVLLLISTNRVSSLRILLTNNNGLEEPGLQLLKTALREGGHDVFVYAPATAFQGAAMALTLPTVSVNPSPGDEQEFIVGGYTATCVLVGISAMSAANASLVPDLIISGINDGYTSGSQDLHSGTLGGALTGLSKGIPSIAVLSDSPDLTNEGSEAVQSYFSNAAAFVAGLVETFKDDFATFPVGAGMKVIYPAINTVFGVTLARDNSYFFVTFDYQRTTEAAQLDANIVFLDPPEDGAPRSDATIVQDGFVSVLPIQSDISVGASRYNENFLSFLKDKLETEVAY